MRLLIVCKTRIQGFVLS